ncbi:(Fe-S)-binding protein [candidate division KSB1 bacterium]|nr:(Fe-S)-binding protein [candidate division KSB1 bacterium]
MGDLTEIAKKTNLFNCLECGKCTSVCPISRFGGQYSPRLMITRSIQGHYDELLVDRQIWTCLTCGMCNVHCPSDVHYTEFTRLARIESNRSGQEGLCSHGGVFQSLTKIMTSSNLKQNRMDWASSDLKISKGGEFLYFVGCLPYFDVFFSDIGVESLEIAKSVIKILNHLGIEPVLLPNERCCGHDLFWTGDMINFQRLAEHNVAEIKKSGAKTVLFSCPECYRTFKLDYPQYVGELGFDVIHLSEFLAGKVANNALKFHALKKGVTYQDPCRLGRHLGIYDPPRQLLTQIPGLTLLEMPKSREMAICCGTSCWTNCDLTSKQIQLGRLRSAKQTGADLLVTGCPKCYIHFKCAQSDQNAADEVKIEIEDLATLTAEALI